MIIMNDKIDADSQPEQAWDLPGQGLTPLNVGIMVATFAFYQHIDWRAYEV